MNKKNAIATLLFLVILQLSCKQEPKDNNSFSTHTKLVEQKPIYDTNKPKELLKMVAHAHGGWADLWKKKDVEFTYNYEITAENRADQSLERYIFDNEISYGAYNRHEINVFPKTKGPVVHLFNGDSTTVSLNGKLVDDGNVINLSDFIRRANYFWFTMPYKLNNPGTIAKYLGKEVHNNTTYDLIEVTYDAAVTRKEQNDIYILYINPNTKLIDRFKFSLPFAGITEPVILTDYSYKNVKGQMIATYRAYYLPNKDGSYTKEPSFIQTLENIRFNNGFNLDNINQ